MLSNLKAESDRRFPDYQPFCVFGLYHILV